MAFRAYEYWQRGGLVLLGSPVTPVLVEVAQSGIQAIQPIGSFVQSANLSVLVSLQTNQVMGVFSNNGFISTENTRNIGPIVQIIESFSQTLTVKRDFFTSPARKFMIPRRGVRFGYLATFYKQPREYLDIDFDFSDWLLDHQGDGIARVDLINDSQEITVEAPTVNGNIIKVPYRGGNDNTTYKVTMLVTTSEGRIAEFDFKIWVKDL